MAWVTTSNFDTELAKRIQEPVAVVEFDGHATQYATGSFSGMTSSFKTYMKPNVSWTESMSEMLTMAVTPGRLRFTLVDVAGDITALYGASNLVGVSCKLKLGFRSLAIADFFTIVGYEVLTITPRHTEFEFECAANTDLLSRVVVPSMPNSVLKYKAEGEITLVAGAGTQATAHANPDMKVEFELKSASGTIGALPSVSSIVNGVSFTVSGSAGDSSTYYWRIDSYRKNALKFYVSDPTIFFNNQVDTDLPFWSTNFTIGQEHMDFDSLNAVTDSIDLLTTTPRGLYGSEQTEHRVGEIVQQNLLLGPLDVYSSGDVMATLLINGLSWKTGTFSVWDTTYNMGPGIDESLVDVRGIGLELDKSIYLGDNEDLIVWLSLFFSFLFIDNKASVADVAQSGFLARCQPAFWKFLDDGKLSLRVPDEMFDVSQGAISDSHIISISAQVRHDLLYNRIEFVVDPAVTRNSDRISRTYDSGASQVNYGETEALVLTSQRAESTIPDVVSLFAEHMFEYLARLPVDYSVTATHHAGNYDIGDFVTLTSANFPDLDNGGVGISSLRCLVVEKSSRLDSNVEYTLRCWEAMPDNPNVYSSSADVVPDVKTMAIGGSKASYDNTTTAHAATQVGLEFNVTTVAHAYEELHWMRFDIKVTRGATVATKAVRLHYNTGIPETFTWQIKSRNSASLTYDEIEVTYHSITDTDAAAVAPTVSLEKVYFAVGNL